MKRAVRTWWIPAVLCLLGLGTARLAGADTIYFKNGTSTWVEEASVEENEVVATRGGQILRFPLATIDRVEKKRTNMPSYRVDVPPPVVPVPVTGPGAPGGQAPVPGPGEPGVVGAAPLPGEPGSAPGLPPGSFPPSGSPGIGPGAQPSGGSGPYGSGTERRGQIPLTGQPGTQN
jgi:hypothetical protein